MKTSHSSGVNSTVFLTGSFEFLTATISLRIATATHVKNLGPWSGSLGYRYLSSYPLSSDDSVQGHGYGIWSGDAHYVIGQGNGHGLN